MHPPQSHRGRDLSPFEPAAPGSKQIGVDQIHQNSGRYAREPPLSRLRFRQWHGKYGQHQQSDRHTDAPLQLRPVRQVV